MRIGGKIMVKSKGNDAEMAITYWQTNKRCTIEKACWKYNITRPTFLKYLRRLSEKNENEDNCL